MNINHTYFITQSTVKSAFSLSEEKIDGKLRSRSLQKNNNKPFAKDLCIFTFCQLLISLSKHNDHNQK